ncbi:hypothetical protein [Chryseobacterium sp. JK1]|uniref:hypothetical protein n=1 Tax=Chryseobacterium sp. JK1 TaxID=874294 RepID=UPI003D68B26F
MKLIILLLLTSVVGSAQLKLNVKKLDYDRTSKFIPDHYLAKEAENEYKGHLLEISVWNDSDQSVSLPLDSLSFGLGFSENLQEYFIGDGLLSVPDLNHLLGVYGFVYQSGKLIEPERADDPFYDYKGFEDIAKIEKQRNKEIKKWNQINQIKDVRDITMNWYLSKNIITLAPGKEFKYTLFFNPYLKMPYWYSSRDYYDQLNPNLPYTLTFKIICNENLYKLLDPEQKKKYKNLFVGVIESNALKLTTEKAQK